MLRTARNAALPAMMAAFCVTSACVTPAAAQTAFSLETLTATQAAADLCARKYTSAALTAASIAKAKAISAHNAFVVIDEAGAMQAARAADAARGRGDACKPLDGVPIVIKDNIEMAGLPTTAGTPALKDYVPKADAPVVAKLRAAGAVVIGKTNMHEMAFGISGYNKAYNTGPDTGIRSAYNKAKMAGGSSSGTGVAVGARVVPAGLGTDTGGSVRIPCAINGCASLRATVGRYPGAGIVPLSRTRDTAGPMAATMGDVALLDAVLTGTAPVTAADPSKIRLGVVAPFMANLDDDTRNAVNAAFDKLKAAGVTIVNVQMDKLVDLNTAVSLPVVITEANEDLVAYLKTTGTGITIETLVKAISSPDVKGTYEGLVLPGKVPGPNDTLLDAKPLYEAAMKTHRPALQALYKTTFETNNLDAIAFPTIPKVAVDATPDASSLPNLLGYIQNADPGSNAAVPGIQLPIGIGATSKLPIGLELDGPAGGDAKLIAVGLALEKVFGRLPAPK